MAIRKNIFDSDSEKRIWINLKTQWDKKFNIYPQIPFPKIFDVNTLNLTYEEKNFILKTNIDYTICDKNDHPLMCLEFDGMCGGYNKGAVYIPKNKYNLDPNRALKLEIKLKIANEHIFPYIVFSYDEVEIFEEDMQLCVLDGIIGQTVAKMRLEDKINELLEYKKDIINTIPINEQSEYIQDYIVIPAEIELELMYDPIALKAAGLFQKLSNSNIIISPIFKKWFIKPEPGDHFNERIQSLKDYQWQGCEVSFETLKGKVISKAMCRNFYAGFASPLTIVQNMAELFAFYKVSKKFDII